MSIVEIIVRLLFFFQAEDGIRDLVRSRGLGDVYKRQPYFRLHQQDDRWLQAAQCPANRRSKVEWKIEYEICLLYTSDAADERSSVDLGGRRIIKKKTKINTAT